MGANRIVVDSVSLLNMLSDDEPNRRGTLFALAAACRAGRGDHAPHCRSGPAAPRGEPGRSLRIRLGRRPDARVPDGCRRAPGRPRAPDPEDAADAARADRPAVCHHVERDHGRRQGGRLRRPLGARSPPRTGLSTCEALPSSDGRRSLPAAPDRDVARDPRVAAEPEWIVYIDLDAYYVSCELRERPDLAGQMVIVGASPGSGHSRGVVLSASYDARALGVRSAMPVGAAARLAPTAVSLPPDFRKYEHVALEVRRLLARFAPDVEPMSIDEAALHVGTRLGGASPRIGGADPRPRCDPRCDSPRHSASRRPASWRRSPPTGPSPGGIVVVPAEEVASFLAPLPVRAIPGVGPKTEARLAEAGFSTIGALAEARPADLAKVVGSFARELSALARGVPREGPSSYSGPRARSTDRTFERDATTWEELVSTLGQLASDLGDALAAEGWRYGAAGVASPMGGLLSQLPDAFAPGDVGRAGAAPRGGPATRTRALGPQPSGGCPNGPDGLGPGGALGPPLAAPGVARRVPAHPS